ncbi:sensor histidine kinase [Paraclostridium sordellii]|uniref:sensor histidine kinase n=2 Tax=Paraclostridium sordellii TaxID=1505 RepID=UPI0022E5C152|nr:HAMP domain-containing sensor histidine kinase [Paeniclostridium sordellii]
MISMKIELRNIGEDIKLNGEEYVNIHTKSLDKDIEFVVSQINYLYDENQKIKVKSNIKEEEIRRSISNISHDLRTPLTSIIGYIQLIQDENSSYEEKKIYIDIVERRSKNLETLISNFYDLSRLEESNYEFNLQNTNLKSILSQNIAMFYNEFIKKDINPNIYMEDDIKDIVTDKSAVNRIFANLINNIIKHGDGGVRISLKNEGDYIVSEFVNKAPNLKEDDANKVFERFYIGDKSRSNSSTGLGLSVTKSLVEKLEHKIEASIVNNSFIITIKWSTNNKKTHLKI